MGQLAGRVLEELMFVLECVVVSFFFFSGGVLNVLFFFGGGARRRVPQQLASYGVHRPRNHGCQGGCERRFGRRNFRGCWGLLKAILM